MWKKNINMIQEGEKTEMGWLGLVAIVAGITVVIAFAVNAKKHSKKKSDGKSETFQESVLENAFGSHTYMDLVKLEQVTAWVKSREQLLKNGAKALVMKATPSAMKKIGIKGNWNNLQGQYLIIAMVSDSKMEDSILIRYGQLEEQLEQVLAKGDGMFVINR